jgi:hypothetical protein
MAYSIDDRYSYHRRYSEVLILRFVFPVPSHIENKILSVPVTDQGAMFVLDPAFTNLSHMLPQGNRISNCPDRYGFYLPTIVDTWRIIADCCILSEDLSYLGHRSTSALHFIVQQRFSTPAACKGRLPGNLIADILWLDDLLPNVCFYGDIGYWPAHKSKQVRMRKELVLAELTAEPLKMHIVPPCLPNSDVAGQSWFHWKICEYLMCRRLSTPVSKFSLKTRTVPLQNISSFETRINTERLVA